ncbi:hypothetical protein B9Q02_12270 [Candidatus Marsarchaeota G1 archaeon BE_D]|nr:MAG: hypothetical protein B9Q02_12270 [Candidatus Marsarchaeota G1 archaeon BE_D]
MWITYAFLSVTIPRSGADWVFQSRILIPSVAASIIIGDIFYLIYWVVFGTFYAVAGGIGPFFVTIGAFYHNQIWMNFGTWIGSGVGLSFFIAGIIILVLAGIQLILPIRFYAKVQWFLMGSVMAGITATILVFSLTPHNLFVEKFNEFSTLFVSSPDYYHQVINSATSNGLILRSHISLFDQFGIFPVTWSLLAWAFWSAQFNGEIRGASSLKNQTIIMLGSGWFTAIIWILMAYTLIRMASWQFVTSASYLTLTGNFGIPIGAYITTYLAALSGSSLNIIILISLLLIMIAFIANGYQIFYNTIGGPIRLGFSMAFDRVLPDLFTKVSERWGTPLNFTILALIVAAGELWAAAFYPQYAPLIIPATLSSGAIPYMFTSAAGALLPFRRPEIYKSSPISNYKIGSLPLITLTGVISLLFNALVAYYWLSVPALGLYNYGVLIFVMGAYVFGAIWYLVFKSYRKKQGIEIDLAFKAIPPE